ncbi:MAG TPA: glycosyltransferase family 4 protein, partial [Flavisolibacter sp.]|nr:glycosyltransferase family 4 protein [Flavisolibacter sp.]
LSFHYPYHVSTYRWHGVTVMSFNGRNKGGLHRIMLRKKIIRAMKKIYSEKRIAGLLSFWYGECAVIGKKFGKKYGIRHGCWVLGQDARKTNMYPERVRPEASELIALSDFLQDEFERNHRIRPEIVVPPGVARQRFAGKAGDRDVDILGVGSLIPLKQYDIFVELVAEIKILLPHIRAIIVGDGPEKSQLQKQIDASGLRQNIQLTGGLPYDEVLRLMQRSKVLLHPSSYEGYSGVCMEALAAGMQVVSFCRAMKAEIENWHIVQGKEEMKQEAISILLHGSSFEANAGFSIEETAEKMIKFFFDQCTVVGAP